MLAAQRSLLHAHLRRIWKTVSCASDYQYLAARLAIFHLRKKAYGRFEPPTLCDHMVKMVEMNKYDPHLLSDYSKEEIDELDAYLEHGRDLTFSYAAVKQLEGKYLVQNRVSGLGIYLLIV